ncbi:macro domain-containing protein [Saccharicrinis fermentans]|uniref:Arylsulfatase n=1 Tax=Saccharicrinis fermentans DSM 9555 = JCM 21142 TaxID=869213 RepID=W7Y3V8_9BACT|nr:hypothetical protein [Saccharicrinis fermentans]GAF02717.1 arylsulfatase [Saccharicrinis fermentans DSM 9555 = JCM 21142]
MYRNIFNKVAAVMLILSAIFSACSEKAKEVKKPNIIFIMSDDHTTQSIGVYGSRLAKLNPTPNIDALAKEGWYLIIAM